MNTGFFQIISGFHQMKTGFCLKFGMISIGFFLKSLKDLKGIFFISFRNPKKLKMLDRPSDLAVRGSKQR